MASLLRRRLFSVSVVEVVLFIILAILILGLVNIHAVWSLLVSSTAGPVKPEEIAPITNQFLNFQDKLNTPVFLAFWGAIGVVAYSVVWILGTVIDISRREVAESKYKISGVASRHGYWRETGVNNAWFLGALSGFIAYVYLYLRTFLPWVAETFHKGIDGGAIQQQLLELIGSTLAVAASLYILVVLHRLLGLAWRNIKS